MPQSELGNLIIELRSLTQGVGTYEMEFDHLAESDRQDRRSDRRRRKSGEGRGEGGITRACSEGWPSW